MKPEPSSPDWIRPGRSGLISFRISSSDSALSRPSRKNSGVEADLQRFARERNG